MDSSLTPEWGQVFVPAAWVPKWRIRGRRAQGHWWLPRTRPALLWYHSHGAHRLYSGTLYEYYLTSDLAFRDSVRVGIHSEIDSGWNRWREHDVEVGERVLELER